MFQDLHYVKLNEDPLEMSRFTKKHAIKDRRLCIAGKSISIAEALFTQ